jgi:6-phosphofructokinase 1
LKEGDVTKATQQTGSGRVGILFSGGPAPASNAVIAAAAGSFRRNGREVLGLLHGYGHLQSYDRARGPLVAKTW